MAALAVFTWRPSLKCLHALEMFLLVSEMYLWHFRLNCY